MSAKYQVIVADPPWSFSDSLKMSDVPRGADANYKTMSMSQINQLPIKSLADPDGTLLALWVPSSLLQEGLNTMAAWGFSHKQTYVWVKTKKEPLVGLSKDLFKATKSAFDLARAPGKVIKKNLRDFALGVSGRTLLFKLEDLLAFGMGRLFRQTHEICLIGTNNNKIYKKLLNKSQRSVSFSENLKHSAKPECLQDSLELMFPGTEKLELFARRLKTGWTCLGNEVCNGEDIAVSIAKL